MKYVGKQKALALAMMAMFVSGAAQAVDLSVSPVTGTIKYIKEAKFDDTSTPSFTQAAAEFDIKAPLKTGVSATDYYLRFQLSAGEWTNGSANLSTVIGTATTTVGGTTLNASAAYLSGDKTGFILPVTFGSNGQPSDTVTLNFNIGSVIVRSTATHKIPTGGKVAVTMSVFGGGAAGQLAANNNDSTQALGTSTGDYMSFDTSIFAFTETDQSANTAIIDVLQQSKLFDLASTNASTTKTVKLCEIDIAESTTALLTTGATASSTAGIDAVTGSSTLIAKGDFSAVADSGSYTSATALGRLYLKQGSSCLAADAVATDTATEELPTALSATEATFAIGNSVLTDFVDDAQNAGASGVNSLCMTVNGTTPIGTNAVTLTYKPVAGTAYQVEDKAFAKCVPLTKNGSTATVPLVLNSSSTWAQYMRITNPSSIGGKVNVYATDDKGLRKGPMAFDLAAGNSTGLISVANILTGTGASFLTDAATVGVGTLNKLRLDIEAEFGTGHNGSSKDGVVVRTYVMPDANHGTFTQFQ